MMIKIILLTVLQLGNQSTGEGQTDLPSFLKQANEFRELEQYDSALISYQELSSIAKEQGNVYFVVMADLGQGNVLCRLHGCELGIEYYKRAYHNTLKNNLDSILHKSVVSLGAGYQELRQFDSAKYYYQESLRYLKDIGDSASVGVLLNNQAGLLFTNEEYDSAISSFSRAAILFENLGNSVELISALYNIGFVYQQTRDLNRSLEYYQRSLAHAQEANLKNGIAYAYYSISEIWELRGDDRKALEFFRLYDENNQTFLTEVYNANISELDAKFHTSQIRLESESRLRIAQKERRDKQLILIVGLFLLLVLGTFLWLIYQRKKNAELLALKNQELSQQKINDLLQQQEIHSLQGVLAGQETERKRIAQDLHDKLGAILGMVKLHFSAVEERIDNLKEENKKQYDKANELLDQASIEVRNISHNLVSGVLVKFGLVPALQDLKETVESTGRLDIQLVLNDMTERLSGEQELQIYRIIQELLSNILKHARATEVTIQINRINGHLNVMVEDNGIGFDIEAAKQKKSIGIQNLEARVQKLMGTIHFDSGKGAGTTVSVDIPLEDDLY